MKLLFLLFSVIGACYSKPLTVEDDGICRGYNACAPIDLNKINVHLVMHSHDDVGWVNTVDQYYYQKVEIIISSVVGALLQNEDRKFIQVETAFFKKWWTQQPELTKKWVKKLINEGRLEIIGGGWSMNDEGAAHYQSTVDQFTLGLRYLEDNLGKCARPKIGWQIDPFGHSREQASIFAQLGFDGFYFARLDYRDRDQRKADKTMDLLWTGSENLGSDSNIFTSVFESHYSAPSGFCFDIRCSDELLVPNEASPEYNVEKRVTDFTKIIEDAIKHRPTNNLLLTVGDDFKYESAERTFNNVDQLIAGFKKYNPKINDKEINLIYSTPSCYAKAVNEFVIANEQTLQVKTDDFFPYADSANKVWAGYFTSRPTSKRYERVGNNYLQAFKQLSALGGLPMGSNKRLEEAMGIFQHHDAITGTEKTAVEKDYHRLLTKGISESLEKVGTALSNLLGLENKIDLKICPLANVSICEESNKDEFNVLLYNPLARTVSHYVQIPVSGDNWSVSDPDGDEVEIAVTEPVRSFKYITDDIGGTLHDKVIIFKAENLPGLGYKIYNIKKSSSKKTVHAKVPLELKEDKEFGFEDKYVTLDADTGFVKKITLHGITMDVTQQMMYYKSSHYSGAYIFKTKSDDQDIKKFADKCSNTILTEKGNVVREIKQVWNDWASQIIRIYKDEDFIEFDFIAGPINTDDGFGKEMVIRYSTNIDSKGEFYTDSNGREMIYRKKNWRATYNYTNDEPQAGNYYPINAKIMIRDDKKQFAVLTDRSEGGSSLHDGEVELMIHRALLNDDGKGVGEALNEQEHGQGLIARVSHFVTLGYKTLGDGKRSMSAIERDIAQRKLLQPLMFFPSGKILQKEHTFLNTELPKNVHLLTLDNWNDTDSTFLIRLEHILEKDEDPNLSQEVTIDLSKIFDTFTITSLKETLLAGNIPLSEVSRLKWPQIQETAESNVLSIKKRMLRADEDLKITLAPMQIRTFIATVEKKNKN
ncbi:lysosomal alpha-mannosidase [Aethina tumida]|uniref:lysosomal alpha-mannosidase n=1 Tax=Aethina tumida TaxID=116153 RepID=UPI00214906EF|nr:lysosomal alpha-mannosidase [Aethina tumida]